MYRRTGPLCPPVRKFADISTKLFLLGKQAGRKLGDKHDIFGAKARDRRRVDPDFGENGGSVLADPRRGRHCGVDLERDTRCSRRRELTHLRLLELELRRR